MPRITAQEVQTIPYGPLGIIAIPGCEELAAKINNYIVKWRMEQAIQITKSRRPDLL